MDNKTSGIPEQSTTSVSFPETPAKSLKLQIIIAVIVLLILAVAAVLAFNFFNNKTSDRQQISNSVTEPSTVPIAKWSTYANKKHNYSIMYPGDWEVRESENKDGAFFFAPTAGSKKDASITISAGQKIGNHIEDSLVDYVKQAGSEIQNYGDLVLSKKALTAQGVTGYTATFMVDSIAGGESSTSLPITFFEVPQNKTLLVRVMVNKPEDMNIYEKMIETFVIPADPAVTPDPTPNDDAVLLNVIKKQIALKHDVDDETLTVTVSQIDEVSAKGSVSDGGGGGLWFAFKEGGVWKLVWDGNGIIQCSAFSLYPDFSKTLAPMCYDEAKQDLIKR